MRIMILEKVRRLLTFLEILHSSAIAYIALKIGKWDGYAGT